MGEERVERDGGEEGPLLYCSRPAPYLTRCLVLFLSLLLHPWLCPSFPHQGEAPFTPPILIPLSA